MVLIRAASSSTGLVSTVANNVAVLVSAGNRASGSRTHPVQPPRGSGDFVRCASGHSRPRSRSVCSGTRRTFSTSSRAQASIKDPYATLGVKRDANAKDIKSAYYGLAKKFHPDTSKEKGAKERFVEIQSAYDILSDEKKKAAFDQYGTTDGSPGFDPFGGGGGSPFGGFGGGFGQGGPFQGFSGSGGNAQDIFEGLFGSAFGGSRSRSSGPGFAGETRGEDLETNINISFEEACRGTNKSVTIAPVERCSTCEGQGLKKGSKRRTCGVCNGTGTRTFVIQSGFQMASTCPACNGAGQTVSPGDECGSCEGVGRVRSRKTVEVKVPAGVDDGAKIRMEGQGDVPLQGSGSPGSLYVRIGVRPSKIWRRQGNNLYYPATVPFHTAILGGRVRVPTLDGDVDVRVPAGTQVGDEMLLRSRGVPSVLRRGDKGDLLVQFQVTIPRSLNKRQKEILQQYVDELEGRRPAPAASPSSASSPPPSPSPPPPPPASSSPPQNESPSHSTPSSASGATPTREASSAPPVSEAAPKESASADAKGDRGNIDTATSSVEDATSEGAASEKPAASQEKRQETEAKQ